MHALLLWTWLAQAADISTTTVALHRGCAERTYWSGSPRVIAAGKIAGTLTLTWGGAHRTKLGRGVLVGLAASGTTAALLNLQTIPRCKEN